MKHLIKILGIGCLLIGTNTLANNTPSLSKYENAKVAIDYTGFVGSFAQQLAYKFNISYYSFQTNPNIKIKLQQDKNGSLSDLLHKVNQQLQNQHLILTVINEKPTLALVNKQTQSLEQPQYIGDIIFVDNDKPTAEDNEIKKIEAQSKEEEQLIDVVPVIDITPTPEARDQKTIEQEKKMSEIIKISQNTNLLAKYPRRNAPIYNIENQEATLLDNIRSTKLSTFLVFKDQVNVNQYNIEANVQDIAKVGNIIGLLHRQRPAPQVITITDPQGNKTVITKTN